MNTPAQPAPGPSRKTNTTNGAAAGAGAARVGPLKRVSVVCANTQCGRIFQRDKRADWVAYCEYCMKKIRQIVRREA